MKRRFWRLPRKLKKRIKKGRYVIRVGGKNTMNIIFADPKLRNARIYISRKTIVEINPEDLRYQCLYLNDRINTILNTDNYETRRNTDY